MGWLLTTLNTVKSWLISRLPIVTSGLPTKTSSSTTEKTSFLRENQWWQTEELSSSLPCFRNGKKQLKSIYSSANPSPRCSSISFESVILKYFNENSYNCCMFTKCTSCFRAMGWKIMGHSIPKWQIHIQAFCSTRVQKQPWCEMFLDNFELICEYLLPKEV